ncbi:EF-P lysine aminoacylase EpmA [Martelella radicis]|uniref:Lysyl-tRNA synthetase class 2 n=1 Tax=Martelella radicis TaxID=1397476 RepID=A0A7W6PC21_9HYPH|nr:EF-P lysine aminoacylase EpmA [Martelella radicis]MBB4122997.1 lysyl-tRNA synthetase class 2 [Martelella radicis]
MPDENNRAANARWWRADRHHDRRPALIARNRIMAAMRGWFADEGFMEADLPALQVSPGNETHLHGFSTAMIGNDGMARTMYLHTSPEFAAKKLLAAGEERLVAFSHVYRNRERGPLHHPEFTMVEWYRAHAPYERLFSDCAELLALAARASGADVFSWRESRCDPFASIERLSVAEAFERYAGIDLLKTIASAGETDREALARQMMAEGFRYGEDDSWSDLFSRVLVERIEPNLGHGRPTLLDAYPAPEAALARKSADDPRVSERFELYLCGVELANGFGELTDATEQRRRFEADMAEKKRIYGEIYPIDEDFLDALGHMPPASGIALGFDRLVMLSTGARRIEDVLWAPVDG